MFPINTRGVDVDLCDRFHIQYDSEYLFRLVSCLLSNQSMCGPYTSAKDFQFDKDCMVTKCTWNMSYQYNRSKVKGKAPVLSLSAAQGPASCQLGCLVFRPHCTHLSQAGFYLKNLNLPTIIRCCTSCTCQLYLPVYLGRVHCPGRPQCLKPHCIHLS